MALLESISVPFKHDQSDFHQKSLLSYCPPELDAPMVGPMDK